MYVVKLFSFFSKYIALNHTFLVKQKALNQANDAKEEGNKLFKDGQYENALLQYELALQIASEVPSSEVCSEVPSSEVCSMCHANRAVCFLKLVGHFFLIIFHGKSRILLIWPFISNCEDPSSRYLSEEHDLMWMKPCLLDTKLDLYTRVSISSK